MDRPPHSFYIPAGHQQDIRSSGPTRNAPSGMWRGYYSYEGRNHSVCAFQLDFRGERDLFGEGVDDVGAYSIFGERSGQRVAFRKTYKRGTPNDMGIVSEDNEGHTVNYCGFFVGRDLGAGFRGTWSLRNDGTNTDGVFHLWPAMDDLCMRTGMLAEPPPSSAQQPQFEVSDNGECIVCFASPISTCLVPCGHIALCAECARRLTGVGSEAKCPICRTSIQTVAHHEPSARN